MINDASRCSRAPQPGVVIKGIMILGNVICVFATIFLNAMICVAVYKVKRLRNPSNVLLLSLSVADLLVTADFVFQIVFVSSEDDAIHEPCLIMGKYHYVIVCIIIHHLVAISIDRLIAIQWHLRYVDVVTNFRILACVTLVWISGALLSLLPYLLASMDHQEEMEAFYKFNLGCSHPNATFHHKWLQEKRNLTEGGRMELLNKAQTFLVLLLLLNLALPFVVIAASYAVILKTSIKHYKQIKAQEGSNTTGRITEIRAAKTIGVIVVSFLVCFTPMFTISVEQVYKRPCWGKNFALKGLVMISSLSAILNPLIYAGRNQKFKAAFRKILGLKPKEQSTVAPAVTNRLVKWTRRQDNCSKAVSAELPQTKSESQVDSNKLNRSASK